MRILYPYKNALWALRPCKAFGRSISASVSGLYYWGYRPRPSKDACSQPHKATMQGRIMTATQSRCTMQRHKQLTLQRCKTSRASNTRHPIFNICKRFFDSLKAKPLRRAAYFNFTLKLYINVRCPKRRRTFCIMNDEKGIALNIM